MIFPLQLSASCLHTLYASDTNSHSWLPTQLRLWGLSTSLAIILHLPSLQVSAQVFSPPENVQSPIPCHVRFYHIPELVCRQRPCKCNISGSVSSLRMKIISSRILASPCPAPGLTGSLSSVPFVAQKNGIKQELDEANKRGGPPRCHRCLPRLLEKVCLCRNFLQINSTLPPRNSTHLFSHFFKIQNCY